MTNLLPGIIGIEVENDFQFANIEQDAAGTYMGYWNSPKHDYQSGMYLPDGNWQFLFTSNSATEEDCKGVVEGASNEYWDGYKDYSDNVTAFHSATESFRSLLQSHGLENKNLAILKQL